MLQSSQYYIFYCAEPEPCVRPDPIKNAYCADVDSNSLLAFFLGTNALGVHSPQRALLYLLNWRAIHRVKVISQTEEFPRSRFSHIIKRIGILGTGANPDSTVFRIFINCKILILIVRHLSIIINGIGCLMARPDPTKNAYRSRPNSKHLQAFFLGTIRLITDRKPKDFYFIYWTEKISNEFWWILIWPAPHVPRWPNKKCLPVQTRPQCNSWHFCFGDLTLDTHS